MNEFFRKNILIGFYFSVGIHFFLVIFILLLQYIFSEDVIDSVNVKIVKYSELGPPPSIVLERAEFVKRKGGKKESFAIPKPVKTVKKDTVLIAKQNSTSGIGGEQNGSGIEEVKIIAEQKIPVVKPKPEVKYYAAVDFMPEPNGGYNAIQSRVVIPEQAKQNNISGKVLVKTYIDEMGKVVRTEIIQGIGFGCNEAAMRAVRSTRFSPGKLGGQYVRVQLIVPVFF